MIEEPHPLDGGKFTIGNPADGLECYGVKSSMVDWYMPDAWDLIEPAAARNGLYTRESLHAGLKQGLQQLWLAEQDGRAVMALITEIAEYPTRRQCDILLIGGNDLARLLPFLETIEAWARVNGCNRMRVEGREGWKRMLSGLGYDLRSVILAKELNDG